MALSLARSIPTMPPTVEYKLTARGAAHGEPIFCGLWRPAEVIQTRVQGRVIQA
jgi:hypothetical protein